MRETASASSLFRRAGPHLLALAVPALFAQWASAACQITSDVAGGPAASPRDDAGSPVIREIHIANGDVFDLDDPEHDGVLHHFLNALHVQTDEAVIRRQLLFSEGDAIDENTFAETARYLRANRYLADARVAPDNCEDGYVDVRVETTDAWSLIPSISFSRQGGQNYGGFDIQETNLFGTGSEIKLSFDSDIERDRVGLKYADRQLGDSRIGLLAALSDNDDGNSYALQLEQPFYSLDTRHAGGFRGRIFDQVDGFFERGERVADFRHRAQQYVGRYGWSRGLRSGRVSRWTVGVGHDEHRFDPIGDAALTPAPPADRRDVYPFVGFEWLENHYEKARDEDQMARIEDRHLGTRLSLQIGYALKPFGALQNALRLEAAASRGFHPFSGDTVMLSSDLEWRRPQDGRDSYLVQTEARYYHRQSDKRLFFMQFRAAAGENADTDRRLALGGDSGLRAYPIDYLNGDTTALLTLEQRFYTDWYPFGLFRVGAAAFLDAGKVWRSRESLPADAGTFRDAGVGLRIGSPHSSSGRMLHIDAAYALDGPESIRGWQLYIESRTSF